MRQPFIVQNEILSRNPPPEPVPDTDRLFIGSLDKAVRVLYAFGGNESRLTATEIAKETGLNVSAVQRFTHTLTTLGLLEKDERTKQYGLSVRLLDFAYLYLRSDPLSAVAYPHLLELAQETGEYVNLSVLDGADVIYVVRVAGSSYSGRRDLIGGRMPSLCTSNGRIMLAHLPEKTAREIVQTANRHPMTPKSLVKPADIMKKISEARDYGYCIVDEESELDVISVACPVLDADGRPVCAINIPLTKANWSATEIRKKLLPSLTETTRTITKALSGRYMTDRY